MQNDICTLSPPRPLRPLCQSSKSLFVRTDCPYGLDFQKSPSSYLFSTCQTNNFSYLFGTRWFKLYRVKSRFMILQKRKREILLLEHQLLPNCVKKFERKNLIQVQDTFTNTLPTVHFIGAYGPPSTPKIQRLQTIQNQLKRPNCCFQEGLNISEMMKLKCTQTGVLRSSGKLNL